MPQLDLSLYQKYSVTPTNQQLQHMDRSSMFNRDLSESLMLETGKVKVKVSHVGKPPLI